MKFRVTPLLLNAYGPADGDGDGIDATEIDLPDEAVKAWIESTQKAELWGAIIGAMAENHFSLPEAVCFLGRVSSKAEDAADPARDSQYTATYSADR